MSYKNKQKTSCERLTGLKDILKLQAEGKWTCGEYCLIAKAIKSYRKLCSLPIRETVFRDFWRFFLLFDS